MYHKKSFKFWGVMLICLFLLVGCSQKESEENHEMKWEDCNTVEEKVAYQMEHLSLKEKIGQMLIVPYYSSTFDNALQTAWTTNQPGGFIMFPENFSSYEKTLAFVEQLESLSKIPPFISIDQEGGRVQRLKTLEDATITVFPPMLEVGETEDTAISKEAGKAMAEELRVFGINMDFAPVLDVYSNPDNTVIGNRSFGRDVTTVTNMGLSFAEGLKEAGIIPVYKHFPGHGNTATDSHYDVPIVTKTKEELLASDLIPFQKAIDQGANVIMVGHIAVPTITGDDTPASLSSKLITDLLKEEMGFSGLVVTDALNMGALTNHYSEKEIYEKAINAGVDLLLMPSSSSNAIKLIQESIDDGTISPSQIDASVQKILTLKYQQLGQEKLPKHYLGSLEHQEVIQKIQEKTNN